MENREPMSTSFGQLILQRFPEIAPTVHEMDLQALAAHSVSTMHLLRLIPTFTQGAPLYAVDFSASEPRPAIRGLHSDDHALYLEVWGKYQMLKSLLSKGRVAEAAALVGEALSKLHYAPIRTRAQHVFLARYFVTILGRIADAYGLHTTTVDLWHTIWEHYGYGTVQGLVYIIYYHYYPVGHKTPSMLLTLLISELLGGANAIEALNQPPANGPSTPPPSPVSQLTPYL